MEVCVQAVSFGTEHGVLFQKGGPFSKWVDIESAQHRHNPKHTERVSVSGLLGGRANE